MWDVEASVAPLIKSDDLAEGDIPNGLHATKNLLPTTSLHSLMQYHFRRLQSIKWVCSCCRQRP